MFRKVVIGMALVAIACALASAGYKAGQALAEREQAAETGRAG